MQMQKGNAVIVVIVIIFAVIIVSGSFAYQNYLTLRDEKISGCTTEAKICPDGFAVGRTGPNCEFTECPEIQDPTAGWNTYTYPASESGILPTITFSYPAKLGDRPDYISSRKTNAPETIFTNWAGLIDFKPNKSIFSDNGLRMDFSLKYITGDDFDGFVNDQISPLKNNIDSEKNLLIDGKKAKRVRYIISGQFGGNDYYSWYFIYLGSGKIFHITTSGDEKLSYDNDAQELSTVDKIISTFKFIAPADIYSNVKAQLAADGWMPIIPESYSRLSGLVETNTEDPIFYDFPEIASCGSGRYAICTVDFQKGTLKRHLNLQQRDINGKMQWVVVGDD